MEPSFDLHCKNNMDIYKKTNLKIRKTLLPKVVLFFDNISFVPT